MHFKVGDIVRMLSREDYPGTGIDDYRGEIGRINQVCQNYYVLYGDNKEGSFFTHCKYFGFFSEHELELVNPAQKGGNMRKRYILLKDSPSYEKGAVFEEMCDDGTQDFKLITPESEKYPDGRGCGVLRKVVTSQPKWFQEVVPVYLTPEELTKVKKIIGKR